MGTKDNLEAAFAGESQANRRYLAFSEKADQEGYPQIAKLFRAAAAAETVHALSHLRVLGAVGSTTDNLKAAIEGEGYEHTSMYPRFIAEAKDEGDTEAGRSFQLANEVEKIHDELYRKALSMVDSLPRVDYYVCRVCGNTVEGGAPDQCPVCGAPKEKFMEIL